MQFLCSMRPVTRVMASPVTAFPVESENLCEYEQEASEHHGETHAIRWHMRNGMERGEILALVIQLLGRIRAQGRRARYGRGMVGSEPQLRRRTQLYSVRERSTQKTNRASSGSHINRPRPHAARRDCTLQAAF